MQRDSEVIAAALLRDAIINGTESSIVELLRQYGRYLPEPILNDTGIKLRVPQKEKRIFAIVSILLNTCYGADTEKGAQLAAATLKLLAQEWALFQVQNPTDLQRLCIATLTACIYAHYEQGLWDECESLIEQAVNFTFAEGFDEYWNAVAIIVRIKVAGNKINEAEKWLSRIPFQENPRAPLVGLARSELAAFVSKRFELDKRPLTEHQARSIWERAFTENLYILERLSKNVSTASVSAKQILAFGPEDLQPLVKQLEDMRNLAVEDLPFQEKYAQLAKKNVNWRETLFLLLNPKSDLNHETKEWCSRVLDRASYIHAKAQPESAEAENCLVDLIRVRDWSLRCGDWHRVWLAEWSRLLIFESLGLFEQSTALVRPLVLSLFARVTATENVEERSNIANFLPGLAGKICKLRHYSDDKLTLFAACELRKERSLLASVAATAWMDRNSPIEPLALGTRTHYLSYTVIYHDDHIQACLYTSDGNLSNQKINLRLETLKKHVKHWRLDPANWSNLWLDNTDTPQQVLAPLLAPIEEALGTGRIKPRDHICIAADDPVNLVPLHYLPIGKIDNIAVKLVSMSRVASFADARSLATGPILRPTQSIAIFIPSASKADFQRRQDFQHTASFLKDRSSCHKTISDSAVVAEQVLDALQNDSVIHLYAHGVFPEEENPYTHSGLVVSDGNGPPVLDGDQSRLLTPEYLLLRRPKLFGSHVTLCACVSGLGLEGKGGDILGMETALRYCGASSILATHWAVRWQDANVFAREFYHRWLENRQSRAEAWRQTIEFLMTKQDPSSRNKAEEWCAFSLYGGWR